MRNSLLTILALTALFLFGCGQQQVIQPEENIKIGVIAPLTGGAAELGQHIRRGVRLANERLNQKYKLVYEDDKCIDTKSALSSAQKFIQLDKIKFVIGPLCTPPYMAVSQVFNENKISFMHTSGVAEAHIEPAGDFGIPGMSAAQFQEMEYLAKFIFNDLKLRKIALLAWNQEWALQYRLGFKENFEKLGGKIVADELFNTEDQEYKTKVLKIVNSNSDGALIVGFNSQAAQIIKELKVLDKELPVFGQLDNDDSSFLEAVSEAGEGMMWAFPIINFDDEETKWFIEKYGERFNVYPNYYAFVGYDSLKLYDYALEICGPEPKCVTDTILNVENYPGISGSINFYEKEIIREFEMRVIQDGEIKVFSEN